MFRPLTSPHRRPPRRGTAVLITCFFLITVMMVTGLALMMYAAREKAAAQAYQEAGAGVPRMNPVPEPVVNAFLGALIYDAGNDGADLTNALRGHSLARAMYGGRPGSTTAWAGVGTFDEDAATYTYDGTNRYPSLNGLRRTQVVNHTALSVDGHALVVDPEWTGSRGNATPGTVPPFNNGAGRNYVGKHAGYTYPDLKNFFLAARDPATGAILTPSFHRDWLFGSLAPNNPNWTNPTGKLLTLRPRPQEHPGFPRVPANEDGSYTGDVQNSPGSYVYSPTLNRFVAYNDSLWMHIGLPTMTLENGRVVQPLVAPLVLPADGNFDLSTHGNALNGGSHASHRGHGPWEINPNYGLVGVNNAAAPPTGGEIQAMLGLGQRAANHGTAFDPYTAGRELKRYAPTAWTGAQVVFALPAGADLTGEPSWDSPTFAPPFGGFQNDNNAFANHPAGYNANEFAARSDVNATSPVFPFTDLKRYGLRFASTPDWYGQSFAGRVGTPAGPLQNTFRGNAAAFVPAPKQGDASAYRLDPAHARRNLFSVRNSGLDRAALAPLFTDRTPAAALQMPVGTLKPGALSPIANTAPYPAAGVAPLGTAADFPAANQWVNALAAIGSVNLNRPLADYRGDTTQPLSLAGNVTAATAAQADADRQALARDIFARLIVATGAAAQVDPTTGAVTILADPTDPTQLPAFNALRYLAQLAANVVDDVDNDDISTVFIWNPVTANAPDPTVDLTAANLGNRAVFGVEKPRLLLNEVYGEITNAPGDAVEDPIDPMTNMRPPLDPMAQAHVKFWAELVNPTNNPHVNAATAVLGDGSVPLSAYQIQIARRVRTTGLPMGTAAQDLGDPLTNPAHPLFASNVVGAFGGLPGAGPLPAPDAVFTFPLTPAAGQPGTVSPNNGQYAPAPATLPTGGFVLVGPQPPATPKMNAQEFAPPTGAMAGVWQTAIQSPPLAPSTGAAPSPGMGYTITMPPSATLVTPEFKDHYVVLRRTVNPYLPPNDPTGPAFNAANPVNPYVTVDVMAHVPAFDAVHRAEQGRDNRGPHAAANMNGYDPVASRFSVGKVQPLAGRSATTPANGRATYNTYSFAPTATLPGSMVLAQTVPPPAMNTANEPQNTFGRHNGTNAAAPAAATVVNPGGVPATLNGGGANDTIMLPFDWLPHFDRPLDTAADLFTVRDCPPHLLTAEFVQNTATGLDYNLGYANWQSHGSGVARALELLRVKSPQDTVGHGGRVGGKVNLNAVQDQRVVQGVWDPQPGNRFDINFVNTNVWTQFVGSRSALGTRYTANGTMFAAPVPAAGVLDRPTGGADRPILPFGAPAVGAVGTFAYFTPTAGGEGDTLLRRDPANPANPPLLFNTDPILTRGHPYLQSEPLGKVLNNTTTVSHQFIVILTVGYFDVTAPAANAVSPPTLGAEVYNIIPGDLRQKFVAVVDMSSMGVQPGSATQHATGQPFFTALAGTARTGATSITVAAGTGSTGTNLVLWHDGQQVTVTAGMQLVIGHGADAQVVRVAAANPVGPALGQINLDPTTPLTRDAWGGSAVSNILPGYAGPQPGFSITDPRYRPVVPYVERVQ